MLSEEIAAYVAGSAGASNGDAGASVSTSTASYLRARAREVLFSQTGGPCAEENTRTRNDLAPATTSGTLCSRPSKGGVHVRSCERARAASKNTQTPGKEAAAHVLPSSSSLAVASSSLLHLHLTAAEEQGCWRQPICAGLGGRVSTGKQASRQKGPASIPENKVKSTRLSVFVLNRGAVCPAAPVQLLLLRERGARAHIWAKPRAHIASVGCGGGAQWVQVHRSAAFQPGPSPGRRSSPRRHDNSCSRLTTTTPPYNKGQHGRPSLWPGVHSCQAIQLRQGHIPFQNNGQVSHPSWHGSSPGGGAER